MTQVESFQLGMTQEAHETNLTLSAPYKQVFLRTLGVDRLPFSDNFLRCQFQ